MRVTEQVIKFIRCAWTRREAAGEVKALRDNQGESAARSQRHRRWQQAVQRLWRGSGCGCAGAPAEAVPHRHRFYELRFADGGLNFGIASCRMNCRNRLPMSSIVSRQHSVSGAGEGVTDLRFEKDKEHADETNQAPDNQAPPAHHTASRICRVGRTYVHRVRQATGWVGGGPGAASSSAQEGLQVLHRED